MLTMCEVPWHFCDRDMELKSTSLRYKGSVLSLHCGGCPRGCKNSFAWVRGCNRSQTCTFFQLLLLLGTKNSLMAVDMMYESVQAPWSPEHHIQRPVLIRQPLDKEEKAAFLLDDKVPRYLHFTTSRENHWGHPRSYRIQIVSFAGEHLPEASTMERSVSWGR